MAPPRGKDLVGISNPRGTPLVHYLIYYMKKILYILLITCIYFLFINTTNSFTITNDTPGPIESAVRIEKIEKVVKQPPKIKTRTFTITAYNTVPAQTSGNPCISASGKNICGRNDVVACSRKYKFGTKFEILNKIYICEDRLAMKYDNRLDISFDKDMIGARKFGKQRVLVEIIK